MKVGIIGATGWLGSALGGRLLSSGLAAPADLVLLNRSGPRAEYHGHDRVAWAESPAALVGASDVVVVSVRPEDWPGLGLRAEGKLVLSFMAGVPLAAMAGCGGRIVRAMPNAAAETGQSWSPWFAAPGVTAADRAVVTRLLSAIGTSDELAEEGQVELMSAVSGSGAAYPALMAVAIADFLRGRGMAGPLAWRAAEAVVCGGAGLLAGRIAEAPDLLAAYRDYRGVTAAGIAAAEGAGFAAGLQAALAAAEEKARRMSEAAAGRP